MLIFDHFITFTNLKQIYEFLNIRHSALNVLYSGTSRISHSALNNHLFKGILQIAQIICLCFKDLALDGHYKIAKAKKDAVHCMVHAIHLPL